MATPLKSEATQRVISEPPIGRRGSAVRDNAACVHSVPATTFNQTSDARAAAAGDAAQRGDRPESRARAAEGHCHQPGRRLRRVGLRLDRSRVLGRRSGARRNSLGVVTRPRTALGAAAATAVAGWAGPAAAMITAATGVRPTWFRPPYGVLTLGSLAATRRARRPHRTTTSATPEETRCPIRRWPRSPSRGDRRRSAPNAEPVAITQRVATYSR